MIRLRVYFLYISHAKSLCGDQTGNCFYYLCWFYLYISRARSSSQVLWFGKSLRKTVRSDLKPFFHHCFFIIVSQCGHSRETFNFEKYADESPMTQRKKFVQPLTVWDSYNLYFLNIYFPKHAGRIKMRYFLYFVFVVFR